jgi:K+-sensing histidine kinase KdpD
MGTVVVALQGSPGDDSALVHEAAAIVRRIGGSVVAVRVVPLPSPDDHQRLARAIRTGRKDRVVVEAELVAGTDVARAIADAGRRHDADVVLVAPRSDRLSARLRGRRLARRIRKLSHALAFSVGTAKGAS